MPDPAGTVVWPFVSRDGAHSGLDVALLLLVNAGQGLVLVPEELLKLVGVPPVIRDVGEESPGLDLKWES